MSNEPKWEAAGADAFIDHAMPIVRAASKTGESKHVLQVYSGVLGGLVRITGGRCRAGICNRGGRHIVCQGTGDQFQRADELTANAKLTGDPQLHRGASSERSERG